MDIQRYRFGSGTRPVASSSTSNAGPSRSNGDDRRVNGLLGKLRLEHDRHRRNLLDKQFKANRNVNREESDYETINQVVHRFDLTESIPSTGFLSSISVLQGRRRTPGPRAPESWRDLDVMQPAEDPTINPSESLSRYGNGRRWSRERRTDVYALWFETTLRRGDQGERGTLPAGLDLESDKTGVQSLTSYCLSVMGSYLDRNRRQKRSWLTTNEGKVALEKRFRAPLMVHAAVDGWSGWQGFLDLFDHASMTSALVVMEEKSQSGNKDWDETSSEEGEGLSKGPKAPAMDMLDLSFVPLPSSARRRIQELLKDPLALSNLTSISFAGSGLALGDVVDMICQRESMDEEETGTRRKGILCFRLANLSLAGLGARDETEARSALEAIGDAFQQLTFLDLSYTRTFPNLDGLEMLDTLYPSPQRGKERLSNLTTLGFRQVISDKQLQTETVRSNGSPYYEQPMINRWGSSYTLKKTTRKTVLHNTRRSETGKYLEVVLQCHFEAP